METISKPSQEFPFVPPPPTQEDHILPVPKPASSENRSRRRRREVSSRYLSPTPPNSRSSTPIPSSPSLFPSSGHPPFAHLKKHHRQEKHPQDLELPPSSTTDAGDLETEPSSCCTDENRPAAEAKQILAAPLALGIQTKAVGTKRIRVVRVFGENGLEEQQPQSRKPRTGTAMINAGDRASLSNNCTPKPSSLKSIVAPGSKLPGLVTPARMSPFPLEEDSSSGSVKTSSDSSSTDPFEAELRCVSGQDEFCENPPLLVQKNSIIQAGSEHLMKRSVKQLLENGGSGRHETMEDSCRRMSFSFCHRSLNLARSSCQQRPFNPTKSVDRPLVASKSQVSTARSVALGLPPQPPSTKPRMDFKKGKRSSNCQEDIHALRLLNNGYLQWRFINAKAQAAVHAWTIAAEKSPYSHEIKLSKMRDSVAVKRIELEQIKGARKLQATVEDQMPYLDHWTTVEGDYSSSLSEAVKALQDASFRLPLIGDVKADISELDEVLQSALEMLEELSSCVRRFLPQVEEVENVISDLVSMVSRERALFEECSDLISMAYELQCISNKIKEISGINKFPFVIIQVKVCSLRSQLIQQKQNCVK
ncbi:protein ENDOSPERM DEFECTIVE 1 [Cocos nucifera]|uniref:Protein ENDOSPERM DEFECTIVE 1 n=1 Tax=Cocos nucifera TaxID=13894 RepID=A0A8K0HVM3_COCNU|nr:protein ENDOSPERM DEFECTIVE 1 [Cocos nucifera]